MKNYQEYLNEEKESINFLTIKNEFDKFKDKYLTDTQENPSNLTWSDYTKIIKHMKKTIDDLDHYNERNRDSAADDGPHGRIK